MPTPYQRQQAKTLHRRLHEPPQFLIVVAGPRQVGKTTLVRNVLATLPQHRYTFIAVDNPEVTDAADAELSSAKTMRLPAAPRDKTWLVDVWRRARDAARSNEQGHLLVLDEIQKVHQWSDVVKGLWDADRAEGLPLHVILLGSSPLLMLQGMSESLAGRFEVIRLTHWSLREMSDAFDFSVEDYLYFGGYPGAAMLIHDEARWRNYVRNALIEPGIERDILMMTRVDKPALLRQVFYLGCRYSGQELSFTKMLGQLQDAGNTVTIAHYLKLLGEAGLICGLQKYAGREHRRRASSPKLNALNTALIAAGSGYSKAEAQADRSYHGRIVESAVGAHLHNTSAPECKLHYWRDGVNEVDYVLEKGRHCVAIEVKSSGAPTQLPGLDAFERAFGPCRRILIGDGGVPLSEFLSYDAEHWL